MDDIKNPETPEAAAEAPASELSAELERLRVERAEMEDRWIRLRAEFDNYRRRTQREQQEVVERAAMDTVAAMLPVLDDFERALKVATTGADYAKGVQLIYQRLLDELKKAGLEPIDTTGQPFDPHQHEAVDMVPTTDVEENSVYEEFRRGYHFHGKLLRPAMVRVAVKPPEVQ